MPGDALASFRSASVHPLPAGDPVTQRYQPRLTTSSELHRLAEALWEERSPLRKGRNNDPQALIRELGVQRLELELKNGDLSAAYNEVWRILEHYTELYDFAPVACLTILANGRVGEANFAAATLLGLERSQLVGASILDFLEAPELARFQAYLTETGKTHASCRHLELSLRRRDGSRLHLLLTGVCGDFLPGHGRSVQIAMIDRTAQENQRRSLRRHLEAETAYFDHAEAFLMVLDTSGRVLRANRKALQTLGYERPEEFLGRDWFSECLPDALGPKAREAFRQAVDRNEEGPWRHPVQMRCKDGSLRRMTFRESGLKDDGGQLVGMICLGEPPIRKAPRG